MQDIVEASNQLQQFYKKLCKNVYGQDKHEIIKIMCICLIAREPLLLIGPPGTAKSMLVDHFCRLLGLNYNYEIACELKRMLSEANKTQLKAFLDFFHNPPQALSRGHLVGKMVHQYNQLNNQALGRLNTKFSELKNSEYKGIRENIKNENILGSLFKILDDPDNLCGRGYFSYLLTQFTDPSEILGPINIPKLLGQLVTGTADNSDSFVRLQRELLEKIEEGQVSTSRFERITRNMLPQARVAFLDEVFRADSTILNALLSLINERKFYQPDRPQPAPLQILFGASNALPTDAELKAFVDRFPLRVYSQSFMEESPEVQKELNQLMTAASKIVVPEPDKDGIYIRHFKTLQRYLDEHLAQVPESNIVRIEFLKLVTHLSTDYELNISDRRLYKLFRLLCAAALFDCHIRTGQVVRGNIIPLTFSDLHIVKHSWNSTQRDHINGLKLDVDERIEKLNSGLKSRRGIN